MRSPEEKKLLRPRSQERTLNRESILITSKKSGREVHSKSKKGELKPEPERTIYATNNNAESPEK